ncbi:MAG: hypothetical protein J6S83_02505, partial [Lachnospiraceae bacterium]|nr:hypothetical protein [Lachnospiraceae bacterium]
MRDMRKQARMALSLFLAGSLVISLSACKGSSGKTADSGSGEATASAQAADERYKLVMVEEPKPSGTGGSSQAAPAAEASGAESADTSDPYKNNDPYKSADGGDTSDPYKNNDPYKSAGGGDAATNDPYKNAGGGDAATNDPYKNAGGGDAAANDPYKNAGGGDAAANDPYKNAGGGDAAANDPYKNAGGGAAAVENQTEAAAEPEGPYVPEPSADAKYTVAVTDDGWVKIENEGGDTLGLSSTSGVKIIEEDGYAFKDLNQNGALDVYEDWRKSSEERAQDLVDQMQGAERAVILAHGGWDGDFTTEPLAEDDASRIYLNNGGRGGVTRAISNGGGAHAKWTNALQEAAESSFYGIPAMISIDPANISGLIETLSLASTMDPELAAQIGQETAKQYRAAGVTALLGPQVDIASPIMSRAGGTYGEDPQLTLDIATAYVNAMQSTYDENGEDLG